MPQNHLPVVELLSKPHCHLCEEAKALLADLRLRYPFTLCEIDISTDPQLLARYEIDIPVVFINGRKAFKYHIDPRQFARAWQRAYSRHQQ